MSTEYTKEHCLCIKENQNFLHNLSTHKWHLANLTFLIFFQHCNDILNEKIFIFIWTGTRLARGLTPCSWSSWQRGYLRPSSLPSAFWSTTWKASPTCSENPSFSFLLRSSSSSTPVRTWRPPQKKLGTRSDHWCCKIFLFTFIFGDIYWLIITWRVPL